MTLTSVSKKFWSFIDGRTPSECWLWIGPRSGHGYGSFAFSGKQVMAHRFAYELAHGAIPPGKLVCHRCDIHLCCNPAHLFLGTHKDNSQDAVRKGRLIGPRNPACGKYNGAVIHNERMSRGEKNARCKMTTEKVIALRARYAVGDLNFVQLGLLFDITPEQARNIARRLHWRHIP